MTPLHQRLGWLAGGIATAVVVSALGAVALGRQAETARDLTIHEWGTFTSIAGPDGSAQPWLPLASPLDLPCFVGMLGNSIGNSPKVISTAEFESPTLATLRASVRMETPVLYFYSPREMRVDVGVSFPRGIITEWFPTAAVRPAMTPFDLNITGTINWNGVRVLPSTTANFLVEPGKNHYYAARETDANAVQVGDQTEKFLFYRGMADFPVPLKVTLDDAGGVVWSPIEGAPVPQQLILFENRGGRIGYRIVDAPRKTAIAAPELTASFETLRADLERLLTGQGLYPREARAMVETWRDSWFEEGMRLFYLMPRAAIDATLPIQIYPAPARLVRTFVGRVEIITPNAQFDVQRAFATNDLATLTKYARFLEPIAMRIMPNSVPGLNPTRLRSVQAAIAAAHQTPSCR